MYMELAAHVDHAVNHAPSKGRIALGVTGAIIAGLLTDGGAWAVIGAAGAGGGMGMDGGKIIDKLSAPSAAGKILTGNPTVLLGPDGKHAARANAPDTIVGCHNQQVAEGSKIVMIGREFRPMSRRNDK